MAKIPVSIQLFTLRDETAADFEGTLGKVAKIGYEGVEFAGYGGLTAEQVRDLIGDLGLKCSGAHEGIDKLESDLDEVAQFHKTVGSQFVIIPHLGEEYRRDAAGWKDTARRMNDIGRKLKDQGLQLCYHNHAFEFETFDGQYGLDLLYSSTDAGLVQAELDTYWVKYGGEDPVDYINRYSGRVPLVHIKDMAAGEGREFAEVGEGILDIQGIARAAEQAGSKWLVVEQDVCKRSPLESIEISLNNLKKMGLA